MERRGSTYPPCDCRLFPSDTERHWFFEQIFYFWHIPDPEEKISPLKSSRLIYKCRLCFRHGEDAGAAPARRVACPAILRRVTETSRYTWLVVAPFCPCLSPGFIQENTQFYFHSTFVTGRGSLCCTIPAETSVEAAICCWQNWFYHLMVFVGIKGCFVNRPNCVPQEAVVLNTSSCSVTHWTLPALPEDVGPPSLIPCLPGVISLTLSDVPPLYRCDLKTPSLSSPHGPLWPATVAPRL